MYWKRVLLALSVASVFEVNSVDNFGDDDHTKHLLDHLTEAEKVLLFGANPHLAKFEVVHLKTQRRRKRSLYHDDNELSSLKKQLNLKLSPRSNFLDPHFLLMRRWSNSTEAVLTQHADDELDLCYHRSESAALYVCEDVRGFVKTNDSHYFIHPLPERFHNNDTKAHVIVKRTTLTHSTNSNEANCIERDDFNISTLNNTVRVWSKHRRKRDVRVETVGVETSETISLEQLKLSLAHRNKTIGDFLAKLSPEMNRQKRAVLPAIFVETAVFIDRDLYKHMSVNFPTDTERELVRFVLAMINAVQLIYHDPSLGRPVNFILKRLEILHEDPANLKRPHDIDRFLSNFCTWQRLENPPGDNDPLHWDHALILTGLDLYVVSKNGKVSSQVVGLAPVAGMCTVTSSCTVNEGRHFESVYVVAHEIGHNLGMRHDGPQADNDCDPTAFIMSPTLGSGKITWSQCSKHYLQKFLDTGQARCLLDHSSSGGQLDHGAEGSLPGERFDADQQCMLKYGRGSRHSSSQRVEDVCRDLHCQRERYTWTSHPALEGTKCGEDMYCRGGLCVGGLASGKSAGWGPWAGSAECASSCLRAARPSAGLRLATRRCHKTSHEDSNHCDGPDKKYQICDAEQCNAVSSSSVREYADEICERARERDPELVGVAQLRTDTHEGVDSCAVWCVRRGGALSSRGWALPDGAACSPRDDHYCIAGRCQRFTCPTNDDNEFSLKPEDCEWESLQLQTPSLNSISNKSGTWRRATDGVERQRQRDEWRPQQQWQPASGCHYHCVSGGAGLRLVRAPPAASIQLCTPHPDTVHVGCTQRKSPYQYATMVCSKYKEKVRRLSGLGMQLAAVEEDVERACRVACQDARAPQRFYLSTGRDGWLPLGTPCASRAYCVSGKCLEFGPDDTPLRSPAVPARSRRSVLLTRVDDARLREIIHQLNLTDTKEAMIFHETIPDIEVDFDNPVHVSPLDAILHKRPRPTWD